MPTSAGLARRFAAETLHRWGCDGVGEVVGLLVSELVTNAVLHARSDIDVVLTHPGNRIRVEVSDGSAGQPIVRRYTGDSMTGRGLALVEELSTQWGVNSDPPGKTVWFELAV